MNKIYTLLPILALATFTFTVPTTPAFATVGGPTYVSQLGYSASSKSLYYIETDQGGRGCPPIIHVINLDTNQDREVKSCSETEVQGFNGNQFVSDTYKNLVSLGSINLHKNNIDIKAKVISQSADAAMDNWTDFQATVTQDGKEITKFNFRGCSKDQANIFEGYIIPNSNSMALLISNKGDCFEGGYVKESLSIVKGIKYYDTSLTRKIKDALATEPNAGNLTVYATSNPGTVQNSPVNTGNNAQVVTPAAPVVPTPSAPSASPTNLDKIDDEGNLLVNTVKVIIILIIGVVVGFVLGRKSLNPPTSANSI